MEITSNYQLEWFEVKEFKEGALLYCPILEDGLNGKPNKFGKCRKIVCELRRLEKQLSEVYPYLVMHTELKNSHIMRFYSKLGYTPYSLNVEYDTLWFVKKFVR